MITEEYYVLEREGDDSYPLLEWNQAECPRPSRPSMIKEPIKLCLGEPVPAKPIMSDFHELPNPVVGERIKNLLEPMDLYQVQFVHAEIPLDGTVHDYWLMHVYNRIECVDKDLSVLKCSKRGRVISIEKLVLSESVLNETPLEERLVFLLRESTSTLLIHNSVKDAIMALDPPPEGLRFFRADKWNHASAFE